MKSHTFHIPVMGTGFTVDTPIKVARYGISSVISLVDDLMLEQMRKYYLDQRGEEYVEIPRGSEDYRARRITEYLNLVDCIVKEQVAELQASPFEEGSEITRYYSLLPDSPLKERYKEMLQSSDPDERHALQEELRLRAVPGSIDVNIMTKLDRDLYQDGQKLPPEHSDAMAALRGFAMSTLSSSIVLSAGLNQRLYAYITNFKDFFPDENGNLKKKVTLKVSDYRSSIIQGKYFAKRGVWVSEFRMESGLNCGGHTFASCGLLSGPILAEFKSKRAELPVQLHRIYSKALAAKGIATTEEPREILLTAQGGIGTAEEDQFLLQYYKLDSTGWGTPFMLVPEAVNVDRDSLEKLVAATEDDVYMSGSSPMGIPFWNLRNSLSEETRRKRIQDGSPGSPCTKGHLTFLTEFTEIPICAASKAYVKHKLEQLKKLSAEQYALAKAAVLAKSCICNDLAGCVTLKLGIDKEAKPAVCCGPNIVNFSRIATLEEMISHIYGKISLLTSADRPNMFIKELMIYIEYLRDEIEKVAHEQSTRAESYFTKFKTNLLESVKYYQDLAENFDAKESFLAALDTARAEIEQLSLKLEDVLAGSKV